MVSGAISFLSAMVCRAAGAMRRDRWVGTEVPRTEALCSCHLVRKSTAAMTVRELSRGSSTGFLGLKISLRSPAEKVEDWAPPPFAEKDWTPPPLEPPPRGDWRNDSPDLSSAGGDDEAMKERKEVGDLGMGLWWGRGLPWERTRTCS